ncbi:MAG: response regulator transcription factor [Patescibacteria group bacterium]|nr:response regulator transcription factor [Patescibacteria group bacterium]
MRILIIEDEKETALTIKEGLKKEYVVEISSEGEEGEYLALHNVYDFYIIDLNLPDKNGVEICRSIRGKEITTPILILTGEDDVSQKVAALDIGADDYLTKPFSFDELKARIRALLRRKSNLDGNVLNVGNLTLDLEKRTVKRENYEIQLRPKEFALLEYMMRNQGRVVTRSMILDHAWESTTESFYNTVDVHIKYLRDRIDRNFDKKLIKTVYGSGYKIEA